MLARNIHDEDTIELQLSASELELLHQAAAQAENEARESQAPEPETTAPPVEAAAPVTPVAAIAPVAAIPAVDVRPALADVPANSATAATAEIPPVPAVVPTSRDASEPLVKLVPVRTATAASTLMPAAFPERTARVAPRPPEHSARGTLHLVPTPPPASASAAHVTRGLQTARTFVQWAFKPRPMGLRTAAALISVAVVIAIALWPRTPTPEPAATPGTAPAPTVILPRVEPLPAVPPPAAAIAETSPAGQPAPMRFQNPFDSSEVFEFPAGTRYIDARDQVAQLLIARARERSGSRDSSRNTSAPAGPSSASNKASFAQQL